MKMSIEAARCRFNIDWRSLEGRRVHKEGECACACVACTLPLPGTRRPSKLHSAASLGLQPTATAALANIQKTLQLKTARFIFTYARAGHLMLNELKCIRCSQTRCHSKFAWTSMQHQSAINASDIQGERHTVADRISGAIDAISLSSRPVKLDDLHFGCMCSCLCSVLLLENRVLFLQFFALSPSPMVVACWCLRSCCLCFREDGRPYWSYHVTRVSRCFRGAWR